jgi:hypothetical protein
MVSATDHPPAIDARHPARPIGQKRLQARKLDLGELEVMIVDDQFSKFVNCERYVMRDVFM